MKMPDLRFRRRALGDPDKPVETMSATELMTQFESLGDNCEFGVVQRCCGAEPLGLFRFNSSSVENMIDVVKSKAERLYTDDDMEIYVERSLNEYCLRSRHYGDFPRHSQIDVDSMGQDAFMTKEAKQLLYLKQRFAVDLESGQKIFVRKGLESLQAMQCLRAALREHGDNWLLWVVVASGDHQPGTIDVLKPGLLRGYVRAFKDFGNEYPIDLINWVKVCQQAYLMLRSYRNDPIAFVRNKTLECRASIRRMPSVFSSLDGRRRRAFAKANVAQSDADWTLLPLSKVDTVFDEPSMRHDRSGIRLIVTRDTQGNETMALRTMGCAVKPRDILVVSAWVWVGHQFNGDRIQIAFDHWPPLVHQMADLSKRGCWQLIWASARVPRTGGPVVVWLTARAFAGSMFHVSAWALEVGAIPTPPRRPVDWRQQLGRSARLAADRLASGAAGLIAPKDLGSRERAVGKGGAAWRQFVATAEAEMAEKRFDAADLVLQRALAAFPGDRDLLRLYAWSAHASARYGVAIERWREAMDAAPGDSVCHGALAANLREHGDLQAAEEAIQEALPLFPNDIIVVTEAGRIAQACSRYDEALALWDKALALAAPDAEWLRCRAETVRALREQGVGERAEPEPN